MIKWLYRSLVVQWHVMHTMSLNTSLEKNTGSLLECQQSAQFSIKDVEELIDSSPNIIHATNPIRVPNLGCKLLCEMS